MLGDLQFHRSDIEMFAELAHDSNPLHVDPQYARRTSFGQCLVHGVLGVLGAMRVLVREAPIRLKKITADFQKPLFSDIVYAVQVEEQRHGQAEITILRGDSKKLVVAIEYELGGSPWRLPEPSSGYAPRKQAASHDLAEGAREFGGSYQLASAHLDALKRRIGFRYAFLPPLQLTALLWCSYFIGMEIPGRQALFRRLSLEYLPHAEDLAFELRYVGKVDAYEPKSSMLDISAELFGAAGLLALARAQLMAACRPLPIETSLADLQATVGRTSALAGKVALVTGSSRGLGALTALGCCLHGADVLLHCKDGTTEVEQVAELARSLDRKAAVVRGDVHDPELWAQLRHVAQNQFASLDIFVNNAFPPPRQMLFSEIDHDLFQKSVVQSLMATITGLQTLMPLLKESRGTTVQISSEATQHPPREYALYTMAKSAIEGLVLVLAQEYPSARFITIRPPRLLTDMTASVIPELNGISPAIVVRKLLQVLESPSKAGAHMAIDTF